MSTSLSLCLSPSFSPHSVPPRLDYWSLSPRPSICNWVIRSPFPCPCQRWGCACVNQENFWISINQSNRPCPSFRSSQGVFVYVVCSVVSSPLLPFKRPRRPQRDPSRRTSRMHSRPCSSSKCPRSSHHHGGTWAPVLSAIVVVSDMGQKSHWYW